MTNTLLIGKGKWGSILKSKLKKITKLKKIITSKDCLKKSDLIGIDWVIVATPDEFHYEYVSFCLKNKVNVFCEKPLSQNYKEVMKLYKLSDYYKKKLYIDDIEIFKNKNIKFNKVNTIKRYKLSRSGILEIPNLLFYHDAYLLFKSINIKNIVLKKLFIFKKGISFSIISNAKEFNFEYFLNSKNIIHTINNVNFISTKDYVELMFKSIFNEKVNFKDNRSRTIFATHLMINVKKKLKKHL